MNTGPRADLGDGADGGVEGVGRGDDLVARSDPEGAQRDLERVRSRSHADGVLDADGLGEHRLEFRHDLAEREVAAFDQCAQLVEDLVDVGELLRQGRVADSHAIGIEHEQSLREVVADFGGGRAVEGTFAPCTSQGLPPVR